MYLFEFTIADLSLVGMSLNIPHTKGNVHWKKNYQQHIIIQSVKTGWKIKFRIYPLILNFGKLTNMRGCEHEFR